MRHKNNFSDKNELGKKILSGYIVTIMLLASFVMMIPTALAADGEANSLKTHMFDPFDPETEVTTFGDGNGIVVNVTFDITDYTGDDPSYKVKVVAQDSGEWVWVTVNDSDVLGPAPWNEINEPDDGKYWGAFIIGQDATANGSGGQPSYLHLENGEDAQIIENFDGDGNNVTTIITAEYVGTIRGWVKTNAEPPVAIDNALIQIDDGGGVIASVLTNATGDYIFNENISEGTYDVIASKQDVFEPIVADGISVMTGQTSWSNFSVPINTDITITGYVKDRINHSVLRNAEIMVYKMGYFEGYFNNGPSQ